MTRSSTGTDHSEVKEEAKKTLEKLREERRSAKDTESVGVPGWRKVEK
jgi:hypothetical protein